ncbi:MULTISPECIES: hypothetical protein [unclassified Tenacibaculum]|uniref:hypothetical protein n=1 Tax=unclassified Tenacibaculum TaxID=2635139 RepID=UPI001F30C1CB|nr:MULTISPECIES: hypothetical protein [unclassified Tenacibaculum]MCF2875436.1 hypothetical protein [Tenacibaculum sp. Cn5-1]MCF2935512.1 hypothetical protein [Tenacibaculum sp. Cn5-34]MCG7512072.1 hypothetical protein [Tenacibaculum sp. Cn5-46]
MKKVILGAIAGIGIYSLVKYNKIKESAGKLQLKISGLSNLDVSIKQIRFNLSFKIINPTAQYIGINTYKLLKLHQIKFYNKRNNAYLGTANVNISNIQIPGKKAIEIKDIPTLLPVENLLSNLDLFQGNIEGKLLIKLQFESLGQHFELIA